MNKEQLEMGFNASVRCRQEGRGRPRRGRAQWWFNRMRAVVDNALDRSAAPLPRPEQGYLTLRGVGDRGAL